MKTKNILLAAVVLVLALSSMSFTAFKDSRVLLVISLEVKDVVEWKKGFDAGAAVREKAGIKVLSVCSEIENANQIMVVEEAENAQSAHDFILLLKARGDISKMTIKLYDKVE